MEEGGDSSEAKASAAFAANSSDDPDPIPDFLRRLPEPDLCKEAFDAGVKILTAVGKTEDAARRLVGKWRKDHGDEAVLYAIGRVQIGSVSEPVSYITACLRSSKSAHGFSPTPRRAGDADWN